MKTHTKNKLTSKVFALLTIVPALAIGIYSQNTLAESKGVSNNHEITQYLHTAHKTVMVNGQEDFLVTLKVKKYSLYFIEVLSS